MAVVAENAETITMPYGLDTNSAERFAQLALACIHNEPPLEQHHGGHAHIGRSPKIDL
jgi:hypothetical protein